MPYKLPGLQPGIVLIKEFVAMNIFIRIVSCATNQGVWYVFFFVLFCMPKKGRKRHPPPMTAGRREVP